LYIQEIQKASSSRPGPSGLQKQPVNQFSSTKKMEKSDHIDCNNRDLIDDQIPRKTVPTMLTVPTTSTKIHKIPRYNVLSI